MTEVINFISANRMETAFSDFFNHLRESIPEGDEYALVFPYRCIEIRNFAVIAYGSNQYDWMNQYVDENLPEEASLETIRNATHAIGAEVNIVALAMMYLDDCPSELSKAMGTFEIAGIPKRTLAKIGKYVESFPNGVISVCREDPVLRLAKISVLSCQTNLQNTANALNIETIQYTKAVLNNLEFLLSE